MKKIILVICRGNIIRSPFAEAIFNREFQKRELNNQFIAISRGTQGTSVDPVPVKFPNITFYKNEFRFSKPILDKLKLDITHHISKPVTKDDMEKASLVLAVDEMNKKALIRLFPDQKNKIYKLFELTNKNKDFIDPEGISEANIQKVLNEIHRTILKGFPNLIALVKSSQNI